MTWIEPPPTQTVQAVVYPVDHFSRRQLQEGTVRANLSWRFNLTELKFSSLALLFNGTLLASANPSGQWHQAGFEKQFDIDWILSQAFVRLIILYVTSNDNGNFTCEVKANGEKTFFPLRFESHVQVDVVGKLKVKSRNIYIIERERERILHGHAWIRTLSLSVEVDFSLVCCTHSRED